MGFRNPITPTTVVEYNESVVTPAGVVNNTIEIFADTGFLWELRAILLQSIHTGATSGNHRILLRAGGAAAGFDAIPLLKGESDATEQIEYTYGTWRLANTTARPGDVAAQASIPRGQIADSQRRLVIEHDNNLNVQATLTVSAIFQSTRIDESVV